MACDVVLYCSLERRLKLFFFKSYVASYGYVRKPGTDRISEEVKNNLRRNRNRDSCGKSATGTENTGIRRIPAGICNLGGGRHDDGKGHQSDRRHGDGDRRYDNGRHDDGKGQQGNRRHDDGDGWHNDGD